jgi:hypothetical protein
MDSSTEPGIYKVTLENLPVPESKNVVTHLKNSKNLTVMRQIKGHSNQLKEFPWTKLEQLEQEN